MKVSIRERVSRERLNRVSRERLKRVSRESAEREPEQRESLKRVLSVISEGQESDRRVMTTK